MGKHSKIEWTHHTFNPWWGCTKVSEACKHCYAETWARRVGSRVWGPKAERRFFSDSHWKQPLGWNREAEVFGERRRVFCASMSDVFEDRPELQSHRERLFDLIEETPYLDWLLLTKRPKNISRMARWTTDWPDNVWLGTTIEMQKRAEELVPELAKCRAVVRFLSCEPLLGPLDLSRWLGSDVTWVIAGGESGGMARPTHPMWFRALRDQCVAAGVPFHFKQWGNWSPFNGKNVDGHRVVAFRDGEHVIRLSKIKSGRVLDGRTWDEVPTWRPKNS